MSAMKTDPAVVRSRIPVVALGMSLGLFLAITFVLCVVWGLILPGAAIHPSWQALLPGFIWLSWQSFLLSLAESFACGWYVALIFAPIFNFFSERQQR